MGGDCKSTYPDAARVAVGAVVIHAERVLLVLRSKPPAEGVWAIPGGSVRLGETLKEAAEREVLEETGVRIRAGEPVYTFESIISDDDGKVRFHYVIIDLAADFLDGTPHAGDDALDARWFSKEALGDFRVSRTTLSLLAEKFGFDVDHEKRP
jgi:ADP-ribose pyrophosphatase